MLMNEISLRGGGTTCALLCDVIHKILVYAYDFPYNAGCMVCVFKFLSVLSLSQSGVMVQEVAEVYGRVEVQKELSTRATLPADRRHTLQVCLLCVTLCLACVLSNMATCTMCLLLSTGIEATSQQICNANHRNVPAA